jgi:RHH-type proline utilization regulon transcriptional repressor/proline dehydrogenase/delta 1-pyrroline-5-carboxylate dehydrogenase
MTDLSSLRVEMRATHLRDQQVCLQQLEQHADISASVHAGARQAAIGLVHSIRRENKPGLMEVFLAEYGLSTQEGVALMCLAEALLRVPDPDTIDALIEDKIAPSSWGRHIGHSSSSLVNASTWALMLTGKVLKKDADRVASVLRRLVKRMGEPVIRVAVQRAMKELGHQFVLGRTITEAISRAKPREAKGFTFSYDMLGEAALTAADASEYYAAYSRSIDAIAKRCTKGDVGTNPGISVKLSALHPRYEVGQSTRVRTELVASTRALALKARAAGMGFNIDAEESDRLDLSLDVIEAVLRDPALAGWDGFGVVVQAYGKRAPSVLRWLNALAIELDRKLMVRLVKGAYWDTEIKLAQVEGLSGFPVFTSKSATDVSYICCAKLLLGMTDRIYPQFATHNAHTVCAILEMADQAGIPKSHAFEFQRLQGMGEALHRQVKAANGTRCRVYAPVGAHRDLLAYLVRRLLENGANSSFVNQIVDKDVPAERVASDPFATLARLDPTAPTAVKMPAALYGAARVNSRGWDLHNLTDLEQIDAARDPWKGHYWEFESGDGPKVVITNPCDWTDVVGSVVYATKEAAQAAIAAARTWDAPVAVRAEVLNAAADLYEANFGLLFAVLCREAGKTPADCIGELREAVDFLRYYASEAKRQPELQSRGVFACISPWNFPLAIFTGQIAAALAVGNGVVAKPAESTSLTALLATQLLHRAGVPLDVLQVIAGTGAEVGATLSSDPKIAGICFTGSTATAQHINRAMAESLAPDAPLIAETGGLNAMIVDSTALPQQAVRDAVVSAFQSAGQRCSALRILYVQEDVAPSFLKMLYGAMDDLTIGNPWLMSTDVGPVIDVRAQAGINRHIDAARADGRVLKELVAPQDGTFIAPTVIKVKGIEDLEEEVFGPVLHVATYKSRNLNRLLDTINRSGFGLTFGLHSRIDDRVEKITSRLNVGNLYVNRNQIGAIVGSQPFGGEGLSGTGPKAGGPNYVPRFAQPAAVVCGEMGEAPLAAFGVVEAALADAQNEPPRKLEAHELPGPTGESNRLSVFGRGTVLCLGPTADQADEQASIAVENGCVAVRVAPGVTGSGAIDGRFYPADLEHLSGFSVVAFWGPTTTQRALRVALAAREGAILPLSTSVDLAQRCRIERHICIDTTAAGGNTALLSAAAS